ncbi:hypothetical protein C8R45DRAFT_936000 [Mycena sanguinolenta]|nr:hypothetical protein C8R45DRAFT_936000 [Mycena sanguinolenta]
MYTAGIVSGTHTYAAGIYRKMLKNELEYAENELCKHSSAYTLDASTGTVQWVHPPSGDEAQVVGSLKCSMMSEIAKDLNSISGPEEGQLIAMNLARQDLENESVKFRRSKT